MSDKVPPVHLTKDELEFEDDCDRQLLYGEAEMHGSDMDDCDSDCSDDSFGADEETRQRELRAFWLEELESDDDDDLDWETSKRLKMVGTPNSKRTPVLIRHRTISGAAPLPQRRKRSTDPSTLPKPNYKGRYDLGLFAEGLCRATPILIFSSGRKPKLEPISLTFG